MLAGSCGEKIAFYPYFAGGAGQGQDESLSLATSAALSSGAQHCLPLLTQSSLASRCVHTTNWLITMQLPAVCGWCRCMSNWMNEIFHRKIFVINYSEQLSLGHIEYVPRAVQPGGTDVTYTHKGDGDPRDVPHTVWGELCSMAQAGSSPSALGGAPVLAGPVGSPGAGAAPALLEQRLPKERSFLESKGLRAGAVCEPCWEAEVISWEILCSPEPPLLQGPAQRPVSSGKNSSVGQAELESAEQGSWGSASVSGASWLQLCACTRVTNAPCPQLGTRLPPKSGRVGACSTPSQGKPR